MGWIVDHYKITYNDLFVGSYYVYEDNTCRYYVNSWKNELEPIKDLLEKKGLLKDKDTKRPIAAITKMMTAENRVKGRKRSIYHCDGLTLERIPNETNERFLVYRHDANKGQPGYSDKDHSAPHYEGEKTPEGMREWTTWYAFVKMDEEALKGQRYIFIAGGLGTAPVYPQAKWLHEHGVSVDVIIGARTKDLLIYEDEFKSVCDNLYMCTDDGSYGFKGVGTARLEALVAEGKSYTQAVAIGPMIMMKFSVLTCKKLGIPIWVSMNTLMVDGTGMCGACRLSVGGVTKFAWVDGPEFDGYLVDFDEAMRRSAQYKAEEGLANGK